jgi:hypothetical protein
VQDVPRFTAVLGFILVEKSQQIFGLGANFLQSKNVWLRNAKSGRHAVSKGSSNTVDVYRNNF